MILILNNFNLLEKAVLHDINYKFIFEIFETHNTTHQAKTYQARLRITSIHAFHISTRYFHTGTNCPYHPTWSMLPESYL
jgi:hypothetical protein